MIIVKLKDRLGNQMFQYALACHLAEHYKVTVYLGLNISLRIQQFLSRKIKYKLYDYSSHYNLDIFEGNPCVRVDWRLTWWLYITKKWRTAKRNSFLLYQQKTPFSFDEIINTLPAGNILLDGYWQNEKYFFSNKEVVRKSFTIKRKVLPQSIPLLEKIQNHNSVCLHVRRGDYLIEKHYSNYACTTIQYFINGVNHIARHVKDPIFFIFSDDMQWCKDKLSLAHPHYFIEQEHNGYKNGNCFLLMSSCKHFIISNSSFSWWAAWLGKDEHKIVVAPNKWLNNQPYPVLEEIIPPQWVLCEV